MSKNSNIEWTDHTFNPWEGCQKVGPGCDNCYAEARNARFAGGQSVNWGPDAPRRRTSPSNWNQPLKWNAEHGAFFAQHRRRQRVFCASLADVFDNAVPQVWRDDLFDLILRTPNLNWLLLTKRIGNVRAMLPSTVNDFGSVYPNVWLGATVVNQEEASRDVPKLIAVPAAVRFLSIEPMLGPISLRWLSAWPENTPHTGQRPGSAITNHLDGLRRIDWVIGGGESGPNARPMHPDWARSLRDECNEAGVPFLFKQWGEFDLSYDRDRDDPDYCNCDRVRRRPGRWINLAGGHGFNGLRVHYAAQVGKKAAGRLLDGRTWDEVPAK